VIAKPTRLSSRLVVTVALDNVVAGADDTRQTLARMSVIPHTHLQLKFGSRDRRSALSCAHVRSIEIAQARAVPELGFGCEEAWRTSVHLFDHRCNGKVDVEQRLRGLGFSVYRMNSNLFISLRILPPSSSGIPVYSPLPPLSNFLFSLIKTHLSIAARTPTNNMKPAHILIPLT
jgi:hypothetical protein